QNPELDPVSLHDALPILDELAKRTYDESGDYYVNGLNVRIREHLDTGSNFGYLSAAEGGNNELLAIGIEPGTAYIKGYEVGTLVDRKSTRLNSSHVKISY